MAKPSGNIFISATHGDDDWARRLSEHLRTAGLDVWMASTDLLPGDNFAAALGKALDRANALVVLVSPEAMKSEWVRHEIQYALGQERFQDRLIPVLVAPTPHEDIPWILQQFTWAKGNPATVSQQIVSLLGAPRRREARAQAR